MTWMGLNDSIERENQPSSKMVLVTKQTTLPNHGGKTLQSISGLCCDDPLDCRGMPPAVDMLCTLVKTLALLSRLHKILKHPSRGHFHSRQSLVMQMIFLQVQRVSRPATLPLNLRLCKRTEEVEVLKGTTADLGKLDP